MTMTSDEQRRIEREVLGILDDLIRGCEQSDMDLAFGMFSRGPEFRMIAGDGTLCAFAEYYDSNVAYLRTCLAFALTTHAADVLVLDSEHAVLTWTYEVKATHADGTTDVIPRAGATFVFEKRVGSWTVVRYHESSGV